ncbi:MAG TPA: bifunctional DNA-binding transcriptional regulator/O6-methylguanine-DNA methyltransferase Ada [Alphaproteobacteria bacterium]|nr:bifunctional DNA-binding transcriptional regulator/O6-methylguanine-DNA methyltransferase Ada [Alphaproteobacteria bacterium]
MDSVNIKSGDDERWRAVLAADASRDGSFVYAVRSTGIYCRPSCPSRRPKRDRVTFYPIPEAAEQAGYRPCRRCRPREVAPPDPHLEAVRKACRAIDAIDEGVPTLAGLGRVVGLSPHHLQRIFTRVMGISPRAYADARRLGRIKARLKAGDDVTGALYEAGYGSSSRLYERANGQLGMTPATYKRGGAGARIVYALGDSALGRVLVAATERGVCMVGLGDSDRQLERELREEFPAAEIARDERRLGNWLSAILRHLAGREPHLSLPLDVRATAFQWRVWQALRAIPYGEQRSYGEIAKALGEPKAARAVGRACATNPVALIVPCHRAVGGGGDLTGYRWGVARKKALLAGERERALVMGAKQRRSA